MGFLKLLTLVWPWTSANPDRLRRPGRSLDESGTLEDQRVHCAMLDVPDRARPAEVIQLSSQLSGSRQAFVRLSAVAVDYLLVHEWFWLLSVRNGKQSPSVPAGEPSDPVEESHRTVTASDTQWSIIAPID